MNTPADQTNNIIFCSCVTILTTLTLGIIWSINCLPMQDYPQHLFLAQVNSTFTSTAYNWSQYYETALHIGPYSLFYLLIIFFTKFATILTAGKIFLSLYILLIAALVFTWKKSRPQKSIPWGTLLLFPLAFHQMYFMGFTNFLLSIPLLLFAVIDFKHLCDTPSTAAVIRHMLITTLIFLCHPYTVLVYICLTLADTCLFRLPKKQIASLIAPLLVSSVFAAWYFAFSPAGNGQMPLVWWPWQDVLAYYLLFFNNMNLSNGVNWATVIPWSSIAVMVSFSLLSSWRQKNKSAFSKRFLLYFTLTTIGFALLPFWAAKYSYFNLRLAPISYACAALLLGSCVVSRRVGLCITGIAAFLLVQSASIQSAVSKETAELHPLLAQMTANAKVLPLMFKTDSNILDPKFFPESHAHDYFYYHLMVGGGASPNLFPSPMLPLRLSKDAKLPKATHGFSWQEQGKFYDYILTRDAPNGFLPFIQRFAPLIEKSGKWMLFSNKRKETNDDNSL